MLLIGKLIEAGRLETVPYVTANGENKVINKRRFIFQDPENMVCAEMVGEAAAHWRWDGTKSEMWLANFIITTKRYAQQDGSVRVFNDIRLLSIEPFI